MAFWGHSVNENALCMRILLSVDCPNPEKSVDQMDQCYVFTYTADGKSYTSLSQIVSDIFESNSTNLPCG